MTPEEIANVLALHAKWLANEEGGEQANFTEADFTNANFTNANLASANLRGVDLAGANLTQADLTQADAPTPIRILPQFGNDSV